MPFPVLGSNSAVAGYEIDNSLRMGPSGGGTTPHVNLRRTLGSAGTEEKFTYSCWVKISAKLEYNFWLLGGSQETSPPNQTTFFRISSDGKLRLSDGSVNLNTNRLFRDPSAWYHIVLAVDSTQGTDSNRVKIYVNGVQETSFANEIYPSQNLAFRVLENGVTQSIGTWLDDSGTAYACDDGYISEVYLIDGQQLAPTDFGEFNDNGVWIPKAYDGSYGTNGFKLEFQDSGNLGDDTSGNGNDFTVNNLTATDQTTDTPTNNFATMNPLANFYAEHTFSEGNCKIVTQNATGHYTYATSTMGVANGKWYAEFKASAKSGGGDWFTVGVAEAMGTASNLTLGRDTGHTSSANNGQIGYLGYSTNFVYQNDTYYATSYSTDAYGVGDIIGVALNADDNEVTFYKNGTAQNSGTAFTIGASPTGFWHFAVGDFENQNYTWECNFGNPSNSISSGNSDANGYGNFEYAPPTNYYSLCSKNLAEYG
jgi:hypothetical protein